MKNLILKHFYNFVGSTNKDQMRVLIFHDIEKKNYCKFQYILEHIQKNSNIITPKEFKMFLEGNFNKINSKMNILLTFDDGYKSQKMIVEKFLNPKNIKALFFLVSDFIKIESKIPAQSFIRNNFYKEKYNGYLDDDIENMSVDDVNYLINTGHSVGAHTKTHTQLSKIVNEDMLISEIVDCKKNLEGILANIKIDDFAYTFGDFDSINKNSLAHIAKNYKYIYSGLRGNNLKIKKNIVRRDAINLWEPLEVINCYLNGYLDFLYEKKNNTLDNWIKT